MASRESLHFSSSCPFLPSKMTTLQWLTLACVHAMYVHIYIICSIRSNTHVAVVSRHCHCDRTTDAEKSCFALRVDHLLPFIVFAYMRLHLSHHRVGGWRIFLDRAKVERTYFEF